jgi:hypothetical protein
MMIGLDPTWRGRAFATTAPMKFVFDSLVAVPEASSGRLR